METAEDLFHACDLDNDGFIDREELKYAISKRSGKELDDAALDELLRSLDSDGDGKISYDDFILQFDSLASRLNGTDDEYNDDDYPNEPEMSPAEFEEKMRWIFSFFDRDGDGVVTVDELKELLNEIKVKNNLESADEEIEKFIQQLDKEDRGHIGFTHFFRAIQRIVDPTEDPLPTYSPGPRPKRRPTSWVAPQSIVSMIRKRSDSNVSDTEFSIGSSNQVEQLKRTIETLKIENDQYLGRVDLLQKNLRELQENNEKMQEENGSLKEKVDSSKRSIKQNEKLIKQNRALEANLDMLKAEVTKMKEQSRDLQRACTKLKLEKDLLNDDLYIKRRDLQAAEEKLAELQQSVSELAPALRKSLSNPDIHALTELEKAQEENQILRATLEREQFKVGQMVKLLNEDNAQLKSQLKEDSALIESSNQIIKKLRQALEEQSATSFNSDPAYKTSLLSELEHDVVVRLTPRIGEIEDELARSMSNLPLSPVAQMLRTSLSKGSVPMYVNGNQQTSPPTSAPSTPSSSSAFSMPFSPNSSGNLYPNESNADELSDADDDTHKANGQKLRRIGSVERNASDQINLLDEIDDLEEKLSDMQDKYASLEKELNKVQAENIKLQTDNYRLNSIQQEHAQAAVIPRKLSFSTASPPVASFLAAETARPASPVQLIHPHHNNVRSASPAVPSETPSSSSPKIPRLSLPNTPTSSPRTAKTSTPNTAIKTEQLDVATSSPAKDDDRKELLTRLPGEDNKPQTIFTTDPKKEEELKNALQEIERLKKELEVVAGDLTTTQQKEEELKNALQEIAKMKKELEVANEELATTQQKLQAQDALRTTNDSQKEEELKNALQELEKLKKELDVVNEELTTTQQKLQTFADSQDALRTSAASQTGELNNALQEIEKLKNELGVVNGELTATQQKLQSFSDSQVAVQTTTDPQQEVELKNALQQIEKLKKELEGVNGDLTTTQQKLQSFSESQVAVQTTTDPQKEEELKNALQEIEKLKKDLEVATGELTTTQQKLQTFADSQDALRKKYDSDLIAEREQWQQKLQSFSEEGTKKKLETETAERTRLETERAAWLAERAALEAKCAKLDEDVQSLQNANVVAEATLLKEASDARAMASQARAAIAQLDAVNAEKSQLLQQLGAAHSQLESLRRDNAEAHDRLNAAERDIHALRNAPPPSPTASSSTHSSYQQSQGYNGKKEKERKGRIEMNDPGSLGSGSLGNIALNVHDEDQESQPLMDDEKKESRCCCCIS